MLRKAQWTSPPSNKMALATILIDETPTTSIYRTSRDPNRMEIDNFDYESYINYGERATRPIHSRKCRIGLGGRTFGALKNGRFFCTYHHYGTHEPCHSWIDGYTTWHDLLRHADSEHGPEEVELIEKGILSYENAQWIWSEDHLVAIKKVKEEMSCEACGLLFLSNRTDSKERHVRRGACHRRQLRQKSSDVIATYSQSKRKGGKTHPTHTRR